MKEKNPKEDETEGTPLMILELLKRLAEANKDGGEDDDDDEDDDDEMCDEE